MSFSTTDFDKWMKKQGSVTFEVDGLKLSKEQIKLLKKYPEVEFAGDLPFNIQQEIIQLNSYDNLQEEIDAFLKDQYSFLSRNFKEFIIKNREPMI